MADFASDDVYSGYNDFQAFGGEGASGMSQTYTSFGGGQSSQYSAVRKSPSAAQSSWRGRGFYPSSKPAAASAPPGGGFAGSADGGFYGSFGGSSADAHGGYGSSGFGGFGDSLGTGGFGRSSGSGGFKGGFGGAGGGSFRGSRNGGGAREGRRGRGGAPGGGSSGRGSTVSAGSSRGGRGSSGSLGGAFSIGGASSGAFGRGRRGSSGGRGGGGSWAPRQEAISHSAARPPPSGDFRKRPWQSSSNESSRKATKRPAPQLSASAWVPPAKVRAEEPRKPFRVPDTAPENFKQLVESQHCSLCKACVNSIVTAEVHYNGKPHQRQLRDNGLPVGEYFSGVLFVLANESADGSTQSASNLELPTGELDRRYCKLCDVTFTNSVQMYQHYAGKKHRTNAKDEGKVAKARLAEDKVFCCDVCGIFTNTKESLEMHLTGIRHKTALEAKEGAGNGERAAAEEHPEPAPADAPTSPQPATAEQRAEPPPPPVTNPASPKRKESQDNPPPQPAPGPPSQRVPGQPPQWATAPRHPRPAAPPQRAGVGSTRSSAPAEWPFKCIHCVMIFDCQDALSAHVTSREHNDKLAASCAPLPPSRF